MRDIHLKKNVIHSLMNMDRFISYTKDHLKNNVYRLLPSHTLYKFMFNVSMVK